jgi:seryl-tRNA synthetase
MLDIKLIRENPEVVKAAAKNKRVNVDVDAIVALDLEKRRLQQESEGLKAEQNKASAEIAKLSAEERPSKLEAVKKLKESFKEIEEKLNAIDAELQPMLLKLPNIPTDDTPVGPDESGNVVLRQVGTIPTFTYTVRDHVELGKINDLIDNDLGARVAGARFTYLKGDLVLLQMAMVNYAFALLSDRGALERIIAEADLQDVVATPFVPIVPPLMIKPDVYQRMARLEPREERYYIPSDDLYLIGSAEHTLGPIHIDETIDEARLPLRYMASTAAFRREAGSYGKDTRGIIRLHQFDKIEMESFSAPEQSRSEHELFVAIQEHICKSFGIPYQVVQSCTGDLGDPNARKIDIECWMPGQGTYRETHSADYMTDYQTRRLATRVKRREGGNDFAHTNDATCIAIGRMLVAVMENHQREDGTIAVPEVLVPYMLGRTVIGAPKYA